MKIDRAKLIQVEAMMPTKLRELHAVEQRHGISGLFPDDEERRARTEAWMEDRAVATRKHVEDEFRALFDANDAVKQEIDEGRDGVARIVGIDGKVPH